MKEGRCRSCDERIIWLVTNTGKNMPVDADSIDEQFDAKRHTSHFANCPDADKFRKPKQALAALAILFMFSAPAFCAPTVHATAPTQFAHGDIPIYYLDDEPDHNTYQIHGLVRVQKLKPRHWYQLHRVRLYHYELFGTVPGHVFTDKEAVLSEPLRGVPDLRKGGAHASQ